MNNSNKFEGNKNRFRGAFGQWRLPAAHKWTFGRQGQHALLGLIPAGWLQVATMVNSVSALLVASLATAIVTYTFIKYEWTEDERINDHAYVDIGGYLVGFIVGTSAIALNMLARHLGWY